MNSYLLIFIEQFLFASLIMGLSCSKVEKQNQDNLLIDEVHSYLKKDENSGFNGVVLLAKDNKILMNRAYSKDEFLTNTSRFWIGSITKQFTATAILLLQEQGKISVDDPLTKFIKNVPNDKKRITIHHLLTHTSGLPNNYPVDGIVNSEKAVNIILSSKLISEIGEEFNYSAEGYNLLGILIEIISGQTYEDYFHNNVFALSKLNSTGLMGQKAEIAPFYNPKLIESSSLAKIYENNGVSLPNYGYKGASGVFSTTIDLYTWVKDIEGYNILGEKGTNNLFKNYIKVRGDEKNGTFYGYGWFIEYKDNSLYEIRHIGAEDGGIGHNGIIRLCKNGYKIIVLSNSGVFKGEGRLNGIEWSTVASFGIRDILERKK